MGTGRPLESRVIAPAGFPLHAVAAAGLKGIGGWQKARNLMILPHSFWDGAQLLRGLRPDVVVGLGGYVAGPLLLEAWLAGVPTLLIEPNAAPGFTNRVLVPFIRVAALGFEEAAPFYGAKARVTGHPVRAAFHAISARRPAAPFTLLILGGSQGSTAINSAVTGALRELAREAASLRIIHQTGERDFKRVCQAYSDAGIEADVRPFIDDVASVFERADLVLCRSGASTVAELATAGRASVLVPFAAATDNHQLANARVLEHAGGARVIEQQDLTPERLAGEIHSLIEHPEILEAMGGRARSLARPDAAAQIANLIDGLARQARGLKTRN